MSALPLTEPVAIRKVTTRGVRVPLTFTLGTSAAIVRAVPMLLVDLQLSSGTIGRTYLFCYTPSGARAIAQHIDEAVEVARGLPASPLALMQLLQRRFALLGVTGTVRMALSALDMALWDAIAIDRAQPLAVLLGGSVQPLAAYDSRGLGLMDTDRLAAESEALLAKGLPAVKLRLGYESLEEDLAAVATVRRQVGEGIAIMVDYNQALTVAEAIRRGRALDDCGLVWIEEPIAHDDRRGYARLAQALRTPLQFGENLNGPEALFAVVSDHPTDLAMPDVARIGGVTGWMQAAGIAAAAGLPMSSHLMPELSAQLLCVTPTRQWLEYVDWADAFLEEPLRIADGRIHPCGGPGSGIRWDEDRLARLDVL